MIAKTQKILPSTFRQVLGAPAGIVSREGAVPYWRIAGSGVSGKPERARFTKMIVRGLENVGIDVEHTVSMGMVNADSYYLNATFLDGGLSATTGNYIGGAKGAYITGPKAVLLVALALRLKVPAEFFEAHGIPSDVTFAGLVREAVPIPVGQ